MRRALTLAALCTATVAAAPAATTPGGHAAAVRTAHWIASQERSGGDGQAADAIADLRATGLLTPAGARTRAAALRAGASSYVTSAGSAGKVILGLTASRVGNPRCAGSVDLLAALRARLRNGLYGTTSFDDGLALLALSALHEPVPPAAIVALRHARHGGGWTLALTSAAAPDAASTGLIIEALRAADVPRSDRELRAALAWLRTQRAPTGGFAMGRRDRSEGDTTGIVLAAEHAMGVDDPRAVAALIALQRPSGAIQFTATATGSPLLASLDAVVGLNGGALPVTSLRRAPGGC